MGSWDAPLSLGLDHPSKMVSETRFRCVACSTSDANAWRGGIEGEFKGDGGWVRVKGGIGVAMAVTTSGRLGVGRREKGGGLEAARRGVRGKGGEVAKEKRGEEKSHTQARRAESTQSKSSLRRESSESE